MPRDFKGVLVASITPFNSNGGVDWQATEKHLHWLSDSGVHGFVPCGTTGESATLKHEEWKNLITLSCKVAKEKNLTVVAGCGSNSTEKVLELMQEAETLGAHAALVVTPYYNKPTPRGLVAHYEYLAKESTLPVILYNVPGRTNISLSVETVKKLFENPRIVGIKEASGQYSQWLSMANQLNLKEKALLAGDDDAFVTVQGLGGRGMISAAANVAPKYFVKLYDLMTEGNWPAAFQLQTKLNPLIKSLFMETNPAPAKYALSILKRCENQLRLPLVSVTAETEKQIGSALKDLEILT